MQRILVLRGGALGDFIVTLPALRLLRERWPDAGISIVGNASAAALGRISGCVDTVHSQHEARWSALTDNAPLPEPLRDRLAAFDLVINYWPDRDGALRRHFPVRTGQRFLEAPALPHLAPAARHYCEPLLNLGLDPADFRSRLPLAREPAEPAIAVHPGSGSPRKNWPVERWRQLLSALPGPFLLVGGEADTAAVEGLAGLGEVFAGRPLPELAARLARCRGFLGHDSGVSHLAAAVGTPCVLLFGPTDPAMWAPPGDHVHPLRRGPDLAGLEVTEVLAIVKRHFFADQTGPA
jgi:ADP-heptose:LPS heptosyltransferase